MNFRFVPVALCFATFAASAVPTPTPESCRRLLLSHVARPAASRLPLPLLEFVLRGYSEAIVSVAPKASVISGSTGSLLAQAQALSLQLTEPTFEILRGHQIRAPFQPQFHSVPTTIESTGGAGLSKAIRPRPQRSTVIDNLALDEYYFAFTQAQFKDAGLTPEVTDALKIETLDGPLSNYAVIPDTNAAWIISDGNHVIASEGAFARLSFLAQLDAAQRQIPMSPNMSASLKRWLAPLPQDLADAPAVINYLAERFGLDPKIDGMADVMFETLFALYFPNQTREQRVEPWDARLSLHPTLKVKAVESRVMAAWNEVTAQDRAHALTEAPPLKRKPRVSKAVAVKVPPVEKTPAPTPKPVLKKAVPPREQIAKPESNVIQFRRPLQADWSSPIDEESNKMIVKFLAKLNAEEESWVKRNPIRAFKEVVRSIIKHRMSPEEESSWTTEIKRRTNLYSQDPDNNDHKVYPMTMAWRMFQNALRDPEFDHAITPQSVAKTIALYEERQKSYRKALLQRLN